MRYLTTYHLRRNAREYRNFLPAIYGTNLESFIRSEVQAVDREVDHLQCIALATELGIGVRIEYLDPTDRPLNGYNLPANAPPIVHLLFRPGHYDILYPKTTPAATPTTATTATAGTTTNSNTNTTATNSAAAASNTSANGSGSGSGSGNGGAAPNPMAAAGAATAKPSNPMSAAGSGSATNPMAAAGSGSGSNPVAAAGSGVAPTNPMAAAGAAKN